MYKQYLGDSVYAEYNENGQIILSTENGFGITNTIYLEPEILQALIKYNNWLNNTVYKVEE